MKFIKQTALVVGILLWLIPGGVRAEDRKPVPTVLAPPQYPYELSKAGIGGSVNVEFIIGANGKVLDARVVQATNRGFEQTALAAVLKWRFQPGLKDGRPVNVRVSQVIYFNLDASPVYPCGLLTEKAEGAATIQFAVDANGRAVGVTVLEASRPEFGNAAKAAVLASTYPPEFSNKPKNDTTHRTRYRFLLDGKGEAQINEATRKLLAKLRPAFEATKFSELDQPPVPKIHPEPKLAPDMTETLGAGSAVVEVFIDAEGNVLLPQIVSATHEELGYAAAQAVVDWKYEPPRKGGKKTIAQGKLQIDFATKRTPSGEPGKN